MVIKNGRWLMLYELRDCRNGGAAVYGTRVNITDEGETLFFEFECEHSSYYCPQKGYNKLHAEGDICEILIGSDPLRRVYYEIEINPNGDMLLAKMHNLGDGENFATLLDIGFVDDCFVCGVAEKTDFGYTASLRFKKSDVMTGDGELYFNAYRHDTDGEETDRHLIALVPTMQPRFHVPEKFVYVKDYV
jgi:hypothetical protein